MDVVESLSLPKGGGHKMAECGLTWSPYNGLEVGLRHWPYLLVFSV